MGHDHRRADCSLPVSSIDCRESGMAAVMKIKRLDGIRVRNVYKEYWDKKEILFRKFHRVSYDPIVWTKEDHQKCWRQVLLHRKFTSTFHDVLFRNVKEEYENLKETC